MSSHTKYAVAVLFMFVVSTFAVAQAKPAATDSSAAINKIEDAWCDATVKNDAAALDRILASDFVGVEPDGHSYTKADAIRNAKAGPSDYKSCKNEPLKVRFFGNVAVVQGREDLEMKDGSKSKLSFTDVFVRRAGKWQVTASQDTNVAADK